MQTQSDGDTDDTLEGSTSDGLRQSVDRHRDPDHGIDPLFANRWSPRAMTGDSLPEADLLALFEAARWAPSSFNNQPWRFVYATRDSGAFEDFADLLSEGNREWATDAAALVVIISKTTFDHNDESAPTHSFDTGAAWENLALEGARRGLVVHGMEGFDADAAADYFDLDETHTVEAMAAIGDHDESAVGDGDDKEHPNERKPLDEIVFEGEFTPDEE